MVVQEVTSFTGIGGIGDIFVGVGVMICLIAFACLIYVITKWYKSNISLYETKNTIEEAAFSETSKKIGINIVEYLKECKLRDSKNFQKELEKRVIKEYFEKNK
jgi:hypothetical protein